MSDFGYVVKVKENAPELLRKALSRLPVDVIAIGPASRTAGAGAGDYQMDFHTGRAAARTSRWLGSKQIPPDSPDSHFEAIDICQRQQYTLGVSCFLQRCKG